MRGTGGSSALNVQQPLLLQLALTTLATITLASFPASVVASPPNFIVLIADDVGVNDIGAWGAPTIRTPNIDTLVREGAKLSQFYSAAPICSPSRASLLTGRVPIRTGVYTNQSYPLDDVFRVFVPPCVGCMNDNEIIIAKALGEAGYYSGMIGKWHLGHNPAHGCNPVQKGFSYFYGLPYSHEEGFPGPSLESMLFPPIPLMEGLDIIEQPVNMETLTPRYTQRVMDILESAAGKRTPEAGDPKPGQPFFLYLGYEEAHIPLFAAPDFQNVSRRGGYGDTVQQMDNSIGQIVNKLKEVGLDDNTWVVFASDNGAWVDPGNGLGGGKQPYNGGSNAPFRGGKGSTWEGGFREPAVVWAPGRVPAGSVVMEVTSMMDFYPTFLELAGVKPPSDRIIDGKSIVSLLRGESSTAVHPHYFFWREKTLYAVRSGPWKAHFYTRPGFGFVAPTKHDPPLLFQVEYDPAEAYPVNATHYPEVIQDILAAADAHRKSIVHVPQEYEPWDWKVVPCCNKTYNSTQAYEFYERGEVGLAIWDSCVCSNATTRPQD